MSTRPPFWRDVRVIRVAAQVGTLIAVGLLLRWLFGNLATGLDRQGIPSPFDLEAWGDLADKPAGFAVRDSPFDPQSPLRHLIWVGVRNTAAVAFVGIAIALVLGTIVGIGRLSTNWVVRKLSTLYVETFRNIPVLVIIIFFWQSLFTFGPFPLFNPSNPPGTVGVPGSDSNLLIYSKSRWGFPSVASDGNTGAFWIIMLVVVAVAVGVWRWRTRVNEATGQPHRRVLWSFGVLAGVGVVAFLALGGPLRWSFPEVSESGRLIEGGLTTNDAYIALTLALSIYTASHIAEIV
ncbi:MAG: ABC transporter permease subunit, partial [Actinomycetota bacterium]